MVDLDTFSAAAMIGFDTNGPVEVQVTKKSGTMQSARVRPRSYGITPTLSAGGKTATFVLPRPLDVSFEADGDRLHNLQVFASPIERDVPAPGPHVVVFGPGVHVIPDDRVLDVSSNTTVYIAGGAVVRGALRILNAHNVVVGGHGIVDPSGFFRPGATSAVRIDHSTNVGIRGITLLRSQGTGFNIIDSSDVVIAGAREINADRWSDGIDVVSSRSVLVDDVFLRTSDDCIAVFGSTPWGGHSGSRDITVRNSTLWADVAHPVLVGAHGNPNRPETIAQAAFQNLDVLEHDEYRGGGRYQGVMAVDAGNRVTVRNVRFDDVRVEDFTRGQLVNLRVFLNPDINKQPGTAVDRVLLRDVTYNGSGDVQSQIDGYDATRRVTRVTFENLRRNGAEVFARPHRGEHRRGPVRGRPRLPQPAGHDAGERRRPCSSLHGPLAQQSPG
jgi:Glycosyl hydrolases family 28